MLPTSSSVSDSHHCCIAGAIIEKPVKRTRSNPCITVSNDLTKDCFAECLFAAKRGLQASPAPPAGGLATAHARLSIHSHSCDLSSQTEAGADQPLEKPSKSAAICTCFDGCLATAEVSSA